jgi:hypothetical protein
VFCENPRPDAVFSNLRTSVVTGEQNYIKANEHYFVTGVAGNVHLIYSVRFVLKT